MLRRPPPVAQVGDERKDLFGPVADLMVGVIFIFIILLIGLALHLQPDELMKENERLRDFARYVREQQLGGLFARLAAANETRAQLLEDLRQRLQVLGIEVTIDPVNGTLKLPAGGLFLIGQAEPTPQGRETFRKLGDVLTATLPCYAGDSAMSGCPPVNIYTSLSSAYVEGHTDVVPFAATTGRFRDNWDLSAGRAIATYRLLGETHPGLHGLRNRDGDALLGVSGYAESRPATPEPDRLREDIRDLDRRIEVRLAMTANEEAVRQAIDELNHHLRQVDDLLR
jgi:flagellar motor protein MotB